MKRRRDYIYELKAKLEFLCKIASDGTWAKVDESIGSSTRVSACNPNSEAHCLLSRTKQDALAQAFGFQQDKSAKLAWCSSDRWLGQGASRPDTADEFKAAFLKMLDDQAASGSAVGETSDRAENSNLVHVRDVTAELVAGKRIPASSPISTMAQVALDEAQPAGAGAFQVLVDLSCHKGNIVGSSRRFSVRRALLSLDCGDARGRREAIAGINGLPVVLSNSYGETQFVWVGTQRLLRWEVAAGGAIIGHLLFDAGVVEELAPGDVLRVSLSAWLKHIDTDEIDQDPAFGIIGSDGTLAQLPEDKLAIEQRRLIEHINKLKLKSDGNGYVEIASAELQLERKP